MSHLYELLIFTYPHFPPRDHWGCIVTTMSPAVHQTIISYVAVMPDSHWVAVGPFVRTSVSALTPQAVSTARSFLASAAKFGHWVWETTGMPLDPYVVFRPEFVNRFLQAVMSTASYHYQYQTAQRLNLFVAHFTGTPTARLTAADPNASQPYSARELITFRSSASRRSTLNRRRNAQVLLGLGAGAGLRADEIATIRVCDIHTDAANTGTFGLVVEVPGKQARSVPVASDWVRVLTAGISGCSEDAFAFAGYRPPGYPARVIHQLGIDDPTEQTPTPTRLRATWIVGLLNAGVPLDLLLKVAGLAEVVSLRSYLGAMDQHTTEDFRDLLTGTEASS
jgi:integrase